MEIKVAIFEDNKMLRESLQQLINNEEDMACSNSSTTKKTWPAQAPFPMLINFSAICKWLIRM
jgi:DNA-binding NarL/FixJ family response regulator